MLTRIAPRPTSPKPDGTGLYQHATTLNSSSPMARLLRSAMTVLNLCHRCPWKYRLLIQLKRTSNSIRRPIFRGGFRNAKLKWERVLVTPQFRSIKKACIARWESCRMQDLILNGRLIHLLVGTNHLVCPNMAIRSMIRVNHYVNLRYRLSLR